MSTNNTGNLIRYCPTCGRVISKTTKKYKNQWGLYLRHYYKKYCSKECVKKGDKTVIIKGKKYTIANHFLNSIKRKGGFHLCTILYDEGNKKDFYGNKIISREIIGYK